MFKRIVVGLLALMLIASRVDAVTLTIPNSFVPNTTIYSAQVNANFSAIANVVNGHLDNTNIGSAGIYANQIIPTNSSQATFNGTQAYTFPAGLSVVGGGISTSGAVTLSPAGTQNMNGLVVGNSYSGSGQTRIATISGCNAGSTSYAGTVLSVDNVTHGYGLCMDSNLNIGIGGNLGIPNGARIGNNSSSNNQIYFGSSGQAMYAEWSRSSGNTEIASGGCANSGILCVNDAGATQNLFTLDNAGNAHFLLPLGVSSGGTGTSSPGLVAGTGMSIAGSWPNQTVTLSTPVSIANGGNGTNSPGINGSTYISMSGSWPTQTVSFTGNPPNTNYPKVYVNGSLMSSSPHLEFFTGSINAQTLQLNFGQTFASAPSCVASVSGAGGHAIYISDGVGGNPPSTAHFNIYDGASDLYYAMCGGQ